MSTLVTGAAGFVGAAVARAFVREGHTVHALVRPGTPLDRLAGLDVRVQRADLADAEAVAAVVAAVRPSLVVHAAAASAHGTRGRAAMWRDTVQATASLLDALDLAHPSRVVHLGSSMEYAASARPLREDDLRPPTTARGVAKVAAGLLVRQWADERGVAATALRLFRVYGPHEPPGRLVPAILRALDHGVAVPLPRQQVGRDWVHVDDVAAACLRAATTDANTPLLNVGSGVSRPPQDVVAAFAEAAGREVPVLPGAWEPTSIDVPHWCADLTAVEAAWGWHPSTDLVTGARLTLAEHRATGIAS